MGHMDFGEFTQALELDKLFPTQSYSVYADRVNAHWTFSTKSCDDFFNNLQNVLADNAPFNKISQVQAALTAYRKYYKYIGERVTAWGFPDSPIRYARPGITYLVSVRAHQLYAEYNRQHPRQHRRRMWQPTLWDIESIANVNTHQLSHRATHPHEFIAAVSLPSGLTVLPLTYNKYAATCPNPAGLSPQRKHHTINYLPISSFRPDMRMPYGTQYDSPTICIACSRSASLRFATRQTLTPVGVLSMALDPTTYARKAA